MERDFVDALEREIASLEAALEQDMRFIRLRELRKIVALYQPLPVAKTEVGATLAAPTKKVLIINGRRLTLAPRAPSPERVQIVDAVRSLLNGKTEPTPTRDIYAHLQASGIHVSGDNPINNLSAMISVSGEFKAYGRSGWTIKPEGEESESTPEQASAAETDDDAMLRGR